MSAARPLRLHPEDPVRRPELRVIEGGASGVSERTRRAATGDAAVRGASPPAPTGDAAVPGASLSAASAHPAPRDVPGPTPRTAPTAPTSGPARAHEHRRHRRGVLALAASAAGSFLLEPAESGPTGAPPVASGPRLTVAVFGLAPGCGSTVISRALAVELALRDEDGAAVATCHDLPAGFSLGSQSALRLARTIADVPGASTRSVGRLCLVADAHPAVLADTVRHHAPLVIDGGSDSLGGGDPAAADRVVLVVSADQEPALAAVAARALEDDGPAPILVANRVRPGAAHEWQRRDICVVPDSRVCSHLALSGRDLGGSFSRAIADLADSCGAPA